MTKSNNKTSKKETVNSWYSSINGACRIWGTKAEFKDEKGKKKSYYYYATSFSGKVTNEETGETVYDNISVKVGFKKDEAPEIDGKFTIMINEAFLTVDRWVDEFGAIRRAPKLVVMDYEICDGDE